MPPSRTPAAESSTELGSFRDPDSRVFLDDDVVYRILSPDGWQDWLALAATPLVADDRLIPTEPVELDELPDLTAGPAAGALRHEKVPFVSYPYEWPFSMLKDAALLQLELGRRALQHDLTLKDASPYNVQFRGASPVFVDIGSFERLNEGEPWAGYRQFCMLFLYPLMLQAYRGMPYHALLRGSLDGIAPAEARALLSARRRGVLTHVVLHARLEARYADAGGREVKRDLKRAGFGKALLDANLRKLEKLVRRLEFKPGRTAWTEYGRTNTYSDAEAARKAEFVRAAAARHKGLVWDLGCNDGTYSRVAAEHADTVVAVDADHATVDGLYRSLRDEGRKDILPLVMSVTDPSPDLGWRGLERARARAPRHSRPRALPRAHPPRGDHRQRARARVRRLAAHARVRPGHRVPRARGPDGAEAALGQGREGQPGLRARDVRARPRRAVRGRAHGAARLPDPLRGTPTRVRALHLGALWAFAFAQPLFDLLGGEAQFFVVRGSTAADIVFFALLSRKAQEQDVFLEVTDENRCHLGQGGGLRLVERSQAQAVPRRRCRGGRRCARRKDESRCFRPAGDRHGTRSSRRGRKRHRARPRSRSAPPHLDDAAPGRDWGKVAERDRARRGPHRSSDARRRFRLRDRNAPRWWERRRWKGQVKKGANAARRTSETVSRRWGSMGWSLLESRYMSQWSATTDPAETAAVASEESELDRDLE